MHPALLSVLCEKTGLKNYRMGVVPHLLALVQLNTRLSTRRFASHGRLILQILKTATPFSEF